MLPLPKILAQCLCLKLDTRCLVARLPLQTMQIANHKRNRFTINDSIVGWFANRNSAVLYLTKFSVVQLSFLILIIYLHLRFHFEKKIVQILETDKDLSAKKFLRVKLTSVHMQSKRRIILWWQKLDRLLKLNKCATIYMRIYLSLSYFHKYW